MDSGKFAPALVLNIQNPRIVILMRFIADLLQAVDILQAAFEISAVEVHEKQEDTSVMSDQQMALNTIIQVHNVGIILPTAQTTKTVLNASLDDIFLALPGTALPQIFLKESNLPDIDELVKESIICGNSFLYSNFNKGGNSASVPDKYEPDLDEIQPVETEKRVSEKSHGKEQGQRGRHDSKARNEEQRKNSKTRQKYRQRERLSGVLLFEEDYSDKAKADLGVLRLPEKHSGSPALYNGDDNNQDNILARPAAVAEKLLDATGNAFRSITNKRTERKLNENLDAPPEEVQEIEQKATVHEGDEEDQHIDDMSAAAAAVAMCFHGLEVKPGVLVKIQRNNDAVRVLFLLSEI